ncbi:MAG TPA: PKD domain-containing protein [Candidatus Hydrogenedentes bacterium]|nr:PKD domain-containing protein [Candidatus Hydrogenedentota bacterium]HQM47362.1 PKD domain-containing protein [Candidatus Hydrogenedentota bacterium]
MRSRLLSTACVAVLSVVCAAIFVGCPAGQNASVALIVSPTSLDFGTSETSLTFEVRKNYTSVPLGQFRVSSGNAWVAVSPETGTSTGPDDPVTITVTLDRNLMNVGSNTGTINVTAEGVSRVQVLVQATRQLGASFSVSSNTAFTDEELQFTDHSQVVADAPAIVSWLWEFGDGASSTEQNPRHAYASEGSYDVSLTVSNDNETAMLTRRGYVLVSAKRPPSAEFAADPVNTSPGVSVQFTSLSSPGTSAITSYAWDFGDGGSSAAENPVHAYSSIGTYSVSLTVQTAHGQDTVTKQNYITVEPVAPEAAFSAVSREPVPGPSGAVVVFQDESIAGTFPIVEWFWEFGDGSTSTETDPQHAYQELGVFTVSLTVTSENGQTDTETKENYITVVPVQVPSVEGLPQAAAESAIRAAGLVVGAVTQAHSRTVPLGSVISQDPAAGTLVRPGSAVALVVSAGVSPADFSAVRTLGEPPLTVSFQTLSENPDTPIRSWLWNFGDGTSGTDQYPVHVYTRPGGYTVSLTVATAAGTFTAVREGYVQVANADTPATGAIDLTNAVLALNPGPLQTAEDKAAAALVEEVQSRTGLLWPAVDTWPDSGTVIALTAQPEHPALSAEGYHLFVEARTTGPTVVWAIGADPRGVLYGVGKLLRSLDWTTGAATLPAAPNITTAPAFPLRGHQIGYRNTANSYDAWDVARYEQYIRELVLFGANAIENIPFEPADNSVHFSIPPAEMAASLSQLCQDYDIEYWVWTPADFDLQDPVQRAAGLAEQEQLYKDCVRIDGVFVPGGDPGSNSPDLVMAFLEDLAELLHEGHPDAGVWVSNQGFEHAQNDWFFNYLDRERPDWLAGVVFGPWTKHSLAEQRMRTPAQYPIRHYPDICHNVRCQYPVDQWDEALAHTLNREAPNPRPAEFAHVHNWTAPDTTGFLSYSDGITDDVNKIVWTMRGWDPAISVEEILTDYARFFFGPEAADTAVDGILGLENNWVGTLADNTGVDDTWTLWSQLESAHPELEENWRWQLLLLRAYYDRYIRARLTNETALEENAYGALATGGSVGANAAMDSAAAFLAQPDTAPVQAALRTRIEDLCEALFESIGLQTSVSSPYVAAGLERGAILDTVDWPVNNRWWLENRFAAIRALATEQEKLAAINVILNWENPGAGGYYDDLGNAAKQPHLVQQLPWAEDPGRVSSTQNEFAWHGGDSSDPQKGGGRLSWQSSATTLFNTPLEVEYTGLDTSAGYILRVLYAGRFRPSMTLTANQGYLVHPALEQPPQPTVLEYALPKAVTASGTLRLRWDLVSGRGCQVAELWLVKE